MGGGKRRVLQSQATDRMDHLPSQRGFFSQLPGPGSIAPSLPELSQTPVVLRGEGQWWTRVLQQQGEAEPGGYREVTSESSIKDCGTHP